MGNGRDRNEHGQYADGVPPEDVLEVFDEREDRGRPVTANDITEALGIARRTAHNKLNQLVERGELETRKVGARGRVWWVPIPPDLRADPETTLDERAESGRESDPTPAPTEPPGEAGERCVESDADLDGALAEWEPDTEADAKTARAQTRRTAEYLREHAPERFTRSDLVDALADGSALGERSWWERAVRPGLRRLAEAGLVEYRAGHHDYRWLPAGSDGAGAALEALDPTEEV